MIKKHQKNSTIHHLSWMFPLRVILKDDLAVMLTVLLPEDKAWTRIGFEKESIQIQNIKKPYNTGKKVLASKNWVWSSGFTL